jgi:hypothetical protein
MSFSKYALPSTSSIYRSAQQLSQYAGGAKVYGIYNAINWDSSQIVSTAIDVIECWLGLMRMHTLPVQYI